MNDNHNNYGNQGNYNNQGGYNNGGQRNYQGNGRGNGGQRNGGNNNGYDPMDVRWGLRCFGQKKTRKADGINLDCAVIGQRRPDGTYSKGMHVNVIGKYDTCQFEETNFDGKNIVVEGRFAVGEWTTPDGKTLETHTIYATRIDLSKRQPQRKGNGYKNYNNQNNNNGYNNNGYNNNGYNNGNNGYNDNGGYQQNNYNNDGYDDFGGLGDPNF